MFSEVNAEANAEKFEGILRKALRTKDAKIIRFAKSHILPLYEDEIGETWGSYDMPKDIKEGFGLR